MFYKRRRPLNEEATQTVKEIIQKAQEKQQAAEDKIVGLPQQQQQPVPLNDYSSLDEDDNPHKVMRQDEPIIEFTQPEEDPL